MADKGKSSNGTSDKTPRVQANPLKLNWWQRERGNSTSLPPASTGPVSPPLTSATPSSPPTSPPTSPGFFPRTQSFTTITSLPLVAAAGFPSLRRSYSNASKPSSRTGSMNDNTDIVDFDQQASQLILDAHARSTSKAEQPAQPSFSKSITSVMSGLSFGKEKEKEKEKDREKEERKDYFAGESDKEEDRPNRAGARSPSPFFRRSARRRSVSTERPSALKLSQSDVESETEGALSPPVGSIRPRHMAFHYDYDDEDDVIGGSESSEEEWSDDELYAMTEQNTERNALVYTPSGPEEDSMLEVPDPLGEGVNVVMADEAFPGQIAATTGAASPRRRKTSTRQDPLPLVTSRPSFAKDRCTVVLTHGDPEAYLAKVDRSGRKYMVASDLSEESRYAVEWGIGTVLRDGDEMILVNVSESEKVDADTTDRVAKLRNQQERSTLAYLLARQATSLLQRTKLHVTVSCQAWHARNSRHMLLDLIDFYEPTMVIVGSRGLGQLKGILLGSTSHYLIQRSSVPVMVARRRLKRPAKRTAHLTHRARVPLSKAAIDKEGPGKLSSQVEKMREEVESEEREEVEARERVGVKVAGE